MISTVTYSLIKTFRQNDIEIRGKNLSTLLNLLSSEDSSGRERERESKDQRTNKYTYSQGINPNL